MFANLVQIELIRLFRNKALKIGCTVGALMLLFFVVIHDFLVTFGALNMGALQGFSESSFRSTMFVASFSSIMSLIIPVDVVYTTCEYQRSRLAVNIEGAVRNRLKLCLSEITGIFIFIVLLNTLVFPGLLLIFISKPSSLISISDPDGVDILIMILSLVLMQFYTTLIVYLISKFTSKALFALILSLIVSALSVAFIFVIMAFVSRSYANLTFMSVDILDMAIGVLLAVPVVVLIIALAVRYKRVDRI